MKIILIILLSKLQSQAQDGCEAESRLFSCVTYAYPEGSEGQSLPTAQQHAGPAGLRTTR